LQSGHVRSSPACHAGGGAALARHHLGAAEVYGAAAAERRGVLDEHDLFVVAHPLQDLFGLNQAAGNLLLAGGLMGRSGAVVPTR
jgi:hypothetical protein